jgi:hypothetical protein
VGLTFTESHPALRSRCADEPTGPEFLERAAESERQNSISVHQTSHRPALSQCAEQRPPARRQCARTHQAAACRPVATPRLAIPSHGRCRARRGCAERVLSESQRLGVSAVSQPWRLGRRRRPGPAQPARGPESAPRAPATAARAHPPPEACRGAPQALARRRALKLPQPGAGAPRCSDMRGAGAGAAHTHLLASLS